MSPDAFADILERGITGFPCSASKGTVLYRAGDTVYSMVTAYLRDGRSFQLKEDTVNALAAFGYAAGWLEAGFALGLLTPPPHSPVYRNGYAAELEITDRLLEKVGRYHRLLEQGIHSLEIAPDPASDLFHGAEKVLEIAGIALIRGTVCEGERRLDRALWCYSYGHGWLDAGVRMGLFRITGDRSLFTI